MEKPFIDMINQHRGTIYKVCNLYGRNKELSRDLFQEIVLQLWKSYPSFKKESKEQTWIYRVAINTAISNFRKEIKRIDDQVMISAHLEVPEITFDPDDRDKADQLFNAIGQLNEFEKAIIFLYLDDKSYDEISGILGISQTNVGARIHRIKTKLNTIIHKN
jgi:RNA polymerase sigma factor (sigma-70 family)